MDVDRIHEINEYLNKSKQIDELSMSKILKGIIFAPMAAIAGLMISAGILTANVIGPYAFLYRGGGYTVWDEMKDKIVKKAVSRKYSDEDIAKMYDSMTKNSPQMVKRLKDNWGSNLAAMEKISKHKNIKPDQWRKLFEILKRLRAYAEKNT